MDTIYATFYYFLPYSISWTNSDTTHIMIGQKGKKKLSPIVLVNFRFSPLPDKEALRSRVRVRTSNLITLLYLVYLVIKTKDMILINDLNEYLLKVVH